MVFNHKAKKTSLQITIPENLDNSEDLKREISHLIYMGSRKMQDLLSKLGAWGPCKRVEEEENGRKGSREKCRIKINK